MLFPRIKSLKSCYIILFLISLPLLLQSQDRLQFTGEYQVGPYKGEADFSYYLLENDTILDGLFKMQSSNLSALLEQEDYSFSFVGGFEENFPIGDWRFQFGKYKTERESQVVNYQYRVNVSGIQNQASGSFVNGRPDKKWSYKVDRIAESEVEETLFNSTIEFESGVPQKSFKIENTKHTLLGRCLRNGLAHDEWTLFSSDGEGDTESWFFENGRLVKIQLQAENQIRVFEPYTAELSQSRTISLGTGYLQILKIKQQIANPGVELNSILYQLLEENEAHYKQIDDILDNLGEASFEPGFQVVVEHYPLDSLDSKNIETLRSYVQKAKNSSDALLDDTQLNILKLSDDQSAYLYFALEAISADYLEPLSKLLKYQDLEILDLISREELFESLWPSELPMQVLELRPNNIRSTFTGPDAMNYQFGGRDIRTVLVMSEYAAASVDSIQMVLAGKLKIDQTQQDLSALEKELIDKSESLKQLIDSLMLNSSGSITNVLKKINNISIEGLSNYAALVNVDEKLEYGQTLLVCLENLHNLSRSVGSLQAKDEEIKELYMDAVWQPFISVVMDEEVKKRITAAYRKILIPHILDRMLAELNCNNVEYFKNILGSLHNRMLELREEDTSKLERKLKKEQDPVEILDLFNVESKNED